VGRRVFSQPRPACPAHPNSHVVLDGHYGPVDHRRPRYRCYPGGVGGKGREWHRFTEPLPRQMTGGGVCVVCERDLHPHEGPQTPRAYEFAARHIAEALVAGATYPEAAARARRRAGRFPLNTDGSRATRATANSSRTGLSCSPRSCSSRTVGRRGSLLLDHIGFRVKAWREGGTTVTGPVAFNVLAAAGYESPVGRRRGVTDTDKPSLLSKAALDARKLAEEARASRPRRRAA
jgi:hypothetical protein